MFFCEINHLWSWILNCVCIEFVSFRTDRYDLGSVIWYLDFFAKVLFVERGIWNIPVPLAGCFPVWRTYMINVPPKSILSSALCGFMINVCRNGGIDNFWWINTLSLRRYIILHNDQYLAKVPWFLLAHYIRWIYYAWWDLYKHSVYILA